MSTSRDRANNNETAQKNEFWPWWFRSGLSYISELFNDNQQDYSKNIKTTFLIGLYEKSGERSPIYYTFKKSYLYDKNLLGEIFEFVGDTDKAAPSSIKVVANAIKNIVTSSEAKKLVLTGISLLSYNERLFAESVPTLSMYAYIESRIPEELEYLHNTIKYIPVLLGVSPSVIANDYFNNSYRVQAIQTLVENIRSHDAKLFPTPRSGYHFNFFNRDKNKMTLIPYDNNPDSVIAMTNELRGLSKL